MSTAVCGYRALMGVGNGSGSSGGNNFLLLEDGFYILLEDGFSKILQES